ncbi:MAG: hypothetical protein SLagBPW_42630 [Shewanella algae]
MIVSVSYQYGYLPSEIENFGKQVIEQDWSAIFNKLMKFSDNIRLEEKIGRFNQGDKMKKLLIVFLWGGTYCAQAFPTNEVYAYLDITSFSSSLIQKAAQGQKHFSDLNIPIPVMSKDKILIESEYWKYEMQFVKEDESGIHVCFIDKAKWGSYDAQTPMIIRKYADEYVAIKVNSDVCEDFAK